DLLSYDGAGGNGQTVNWRTGEPSREARQGWWHAAGVSVNFSERTWTLTTFDGDPLLTVRADPVSSYGSLSPDGRYFLVGGGEPGMTVYDVTSGDRTDFDRGSPVFYGWTPDGHLLGGPPPGGGALRLCDPAAGTCEETGPVTT